LPPGRALTDLLDSLPPEVMDLPHRRSWADRVAHYAGVIASALPAERERVSRLAAAVGDGLSGARPEVPTHGDFYESQLLVDGSRVAGLLDVDTVGPGRRADDLACLLAHLHVLTLTSPAEASLLKEALRAYQRWFEQEVDPGELRLRTAGVLVSLATGPHRVQERGWPDATRSRLDAAQGWVEEAAVR
jgi:Ser/Thr protein kinase RdoA (MazF antagonist)